MIQIPKNRQINREDEMPAAVAFKTTKSAESIADKKLDMLRKVVASYKKREEQASKKKAGKSKG